MLQGKKIVKTVEEIIKKNPEYFEALVEFEKTGKLPKFSHKERANFTIDSGVLRKFRVYCNKHGYNMSKKIENFMGELTKGF